MDAKQQHCPHKKGANRKELARREPKRDRNYSQSRDVWEDRCTRQHKTLFGIPTPAPSSAIRPKERLRVDNRLPESSWLKSLPRQQSEFVVAVTTPRSQATR